MAKLVVVSGVPGVGKTTVVTKAVEGTDFEIATFGTFMFEIAKEKGLVEKRDDMRKNLSINEQKEIQLQAAKNIKEKSLSKNIIVDTHCSINTTEGYYPGLPKNVLNALQFDVMALIEGTEVDIQARRDKDKGVRDRDDDDHIMHQTVNRSFGTAYCAELGVPLKIIVNRQGKLEEAAENLRKVLLN